MVEIKTGVYTRNGEDFEFNFKTSMSATDKVAFVKSVVDTLIDDKKIITESIVDNDNNAIEKTVIEHTDKNYYYVIQDLVFDFYIIDMMTNVDTSEVIGNGVKNAIAAMETLLDETNVIEIIMANVNPVFIAELRKAVELNIEYKTGIYRNPIAESISSLLNTIEKKVGGFDLDGMMDMAEVLSGVSGELTAEKMLEAYANSGAMKQYYKEMLVSNQKREDTINAVLGVESIDK